MKVHNRSVISQRDVQLKGLIRRRIKDIASDLLPSWIRSKRATKRYNRHAEQNRAHIKRCTRPNKIQMTFTQMWKCPLWHKGSIAHHLYGLPIC